MSPREDRVVLALGVAGVVAWLLSYSWLLGTVVDLRDLRYTVSPWFVAEVAAVVLGVVAVLTALATRGTRRGRRGRVGAALGGAAALLALLGLAA